MLFRSWMTLWKAEGRKFRVSRIIIISALFILDAIYVACTARELQLAYIDNRDFPGGPLQYFLDNPTIPANTVAVSVFFLANIIADAFLVCFIFESFICFIQLKYTVHFSCGAARSFGLYISQISAIKFLFL